MLTVTAKLLITGQKAGDLVTLDSDFLAPKIGYIEQMNYNLNGNIIAANVVVK